MSKYRVGQKFIIEIGHGTVDPLYGARYFIKGFNTLVFDDGGLDRLEQVNGGPTLRNAYDEGYEKGLKDAWECAWKVAMYDVNIYAVFGTAILKRVRDMNPSEAIAKLKEYEAKQSEIKVGDEVKLPDGELAVVTRVDGGSYRTLNCGGFGDWVCKGNGTKTGRRFDIEPILEQLKGADDD